MSHTCHAIRCETGCRPTMLMCRRHWVMVPANLQRRVYATYRRGQCDDRRPGPAWHEAADAAIGAVALSEGCMPGQLRVVIVRALLSLSPRLFGDREDAMREQLAELDATRET